MGFLRRGFPIAVCSTWWLGKGTVQTRMLQKLFEILEDTTIKALQLFHERYPSKPRDIRVIGNPYGGTKQRRLQSEDKPREEGSSVTILR